MDVHDTAVRAVDLVLPLPIPDRQPERLVAAAGLICEAACRLETGTQSVLSFDNTAQVAQLVVNLAAAATVLGGTFRQLAAAVEQMVDPAQRKVATLAADMLADCSVDAAVLAHHANRAYDRVARIRGATEAA